MTATVNQTSVRYTREEDTGMFVVRVSVAGIRNAKVQMNVDIQPGLPSTDSIRSLLTTIGIAAGACAEELGEKYNEPMDPGQCERDSKLAFMEESARIAELQKRVPEVIRAAEQCALFLGAGAKQYVATVKRQFELQKMLLDMEVDGLVAIIRRIRRAYR